MYVFWYINPVCLAVMAVNVKVYKLFTLEKKNIPIYHDIQTHVSVELLV
jgi:hypothetical protein